MIKIEAEKILKFKDLTIEIQRMVNVKTKCGTNNNKGKRSHLKIIQKIPEQRTGKARNQGSTENSHIVHSTHTSENTNVKVQ